MRKIVVFFIITLVVAIFYSNLLSNEGYPYYDRLRILSDTAFFNESKEIFPLWNPYRNGGFPVLASPEHFFIISQFVDTDSTVYNLQLNIIILLLILCIAYASYIFFKGVVRSTTLISICGAVTIACNQIFLVSVQTARIALLETFFFTICALIFTEKYLKYKKLGYFTLVALCCGLSFSFKGHYFIIYPFSFILMFAIWHKLKTEKQGNLKSILLGFKYSLSVCIIGIIACGFYAFPLIYYQMNGFRPVITQTGTQLNCPSIDTLPSITMPLFFYGKTVLKQKAWPFVSYIVLPGLIAFCLSYKSYRVQRQLWVLFLFVLVVVPFLLFGIPYLGEELIKIYSKIPLLSLIKHSLNASEIIVFSIALLSVVGFNALSKNKRQGKYFYLISLILFLICSLLVLFVSSQFSSPKLIIMIGFAIVIVGLFQFLAIHWWRFSITGFLIVCIIFSYVTLFPLSHKKITGKNKPLRNDIHVSESSLKNIFRSGHNKMRIFNGSGIYRSALTLSNQYLINGFSLYFPSGYAKSLTLLTGRVPNANRPYQLKCNSCTNLRLKGLDLLSVSHILCYKNSVKCLENFKEKWRKVYENNKIELYSRQNEIPYLKTFRKWEPINNNNLLELANTSLSAFSKGIVLIDNIGSSGSFDKPSKQDELKFKRISEGHIHITANVESPAYLVIPENYSKEWKVNINGEKRKLINAFGSYMAVKLDSGFSEVELKYRPLVVYISVVISFVTIFILIILCICRKNIKKY